MEKQRYYLCVENVPQKWTCYERFKSIDEISSPLETARSTIVPVNKWQPYLFDKIVIAAALKPKFILSS